MGTCIFLALVQLVTQLRICTPKITTINFQGLGSTRFISWNIKGIQHPIKRNRVFARLKTLGSDIMYLRNNEYDKLKKNWIGQVFHSDYGDRSRGAAILIRRGLPFTPVNIIPDNKGRFIIVTGKLYGNLVALVNLYGPNWDNPQFFSSLIGKLSDPNSHLLILGGDFNCTLQPALDKSNPKQNKNVSKSGALLCLLLCLSCNLINYMILGDTPTPPLDSFLFFRQFTSRIQEQLFPY